MTRGTCLVIVIASVGVACDSAQVRPSPAQNPSTNPPAANVHLEIRTPESLAPGSSARLKAVAVRFGVSEEDVTGATRWTSDDATIAQVTPDGLATAAQVGEAVVRATYQAPEGTRYAIARLLVLHPGTFKLTGRLSDSGVGIANATVTVISGTGTGLSTATNVDGLYALYGVAGRVRLQAKRDGYENRIEEIDVNSSRLHDIPMSLDRARPAVSGAYTMTLEMGTCDHTTGALPIDARRRRYVANVTQLDARLTVTLSGADFIINGDKGNQFRGTIDPLGPVTFHVGNPDDDYLLDPQELVERINATEAFLAWGKVVGRVEDSIIKGNLTGLLMVADANQPSYRNASSVCFSTTHRFELRRQ